MKRYEWVNDLRGVACLLVVFFHYGILFWTDQGTAAGFAHRPPLWSGLERAPALARSLREGPVELGGLGVCLFFLISGFVIPISLDHYGRWAFLVARVFRILPTYAAGYLISCLTLAGLSSPPLTLEPTSILVGMIPSLPLLTGVDAPADGVVWTLIIELVFYAIGFITHRRLMDGGILLIIVTVCTGLHFMLRKEIDFISFQGRLAYVIVLASLFIPVMLIGTTLSAHARRLIGSRACLILMIMMGISHLGMLISNPIIHDTERHISTYGLGILTFMALYRLGRGWTSRWMLGFLADISYPMYVAHPVLGYALLSILTGWGFAYAVAIFWSTLLALLVASALHHLVESPTHFLGRRLARRMMSVSAL